MLNIELLEQQRKDLQARISILKENGVDATFLETRVKELNQIIEKAKGEKKVQEDRARQEAKRLEAALRNDIKELNNTLDALKKQEAVVDSKIAELSKALENVKGELAANENKLKELHEALDKTVDRIAKDMMVTNDMQAENTEKIAKKEEIIKGLEKPGEVEAEKKAKIEQAKKELQELSREKIQLKEEIKSKGLGPDSPEAKRLSEISAKTLEKVKELKSTEGGKEALKETVRIAKREENERLETKTSKKKELDVLEAERDALNEREKSLNAEHLSLIEQIKSTKNNIEQLRAQKAAIETQLEALKQEKKALVEQQKQLEEVKAQKEKELAKLVENEKGKTSETSDKAGDAKNNPNLPSEVLSSIGGGIETSRNVPGTPPNNSAAPNKWVDERGNPHRSSGNSRSFTDMVGGGGSKSYRDADNHNPRVSPTQPTTPSGRSTSR